MGEAEYAHCRLRTPWAGGVGGGGGQWRDGAGGREGEGDGSWTRTFMYGIRSPRQSTPPTSRTHSRPPSDPSHVAQSSPLTPISRSIHQSQIVFGPSCHHGPSRRYSLFGRPRPGTASATCCTAPPRPRRRGSFPWRAHARRLLALAADTVAAVARHCPLAVPLGSRRTTRTTATSLRRTHTPSILATHARMPSHPNHRAVPSCKH